MNRPLSSRPALDWGGQSLYGKVQVEHVRTYPGRVLVWWGWTGWGPMWPVTDQWHLNQSSLGEPPLNRQTDTTENIIFPQLRWWAVKIWILAKYENGNWVSALFDCERKKLHKYICINCTTKVNVRIVLTHSCSRDYVLRGEVSHKSSIFPKRQMFFTIWNLQ